MTTSDQLWQRLVAGVKASSAGEDCASASPEFVERVLAEATNRGARTTTLRERSDLRTAAWFTLITVAASVLLMVSHWDFVTELLQPPPMVQQDLLDWDLRL